MLDFKKKVIEMKTINMYKKLILMVLALGFLASCVQDDDFDTPNTSISEPELDGEVISIAAILADAAQNEGELYTYEDTDKYVEGYVISSDEGGNFFREIIIQDAPENPTAGLKIALFVNPLFTKYEVGRKIYVALEGFTVGTSNGVVTLGIPDGDYIDPAPAQFESKIVRSAEVAEIVPLQLSITDFSDEYENLFVELNNVQFSKEDVENNLTFAGEVSDEFDGERAIFQYIECYSIPRTTFSTSTFADFKSLKLPQGNGSIAGILSRNFEDDMYVISVNTLSDVQLDQPRFTILDEEGTEVILFEDFESGSLSTNNWTTYAEAGAKNWTIFNDSENIPSMGTAVRINSFQSNDDSNIAWLISQAINFDANNMETMTFKTSNSFSDGSELEVLISTDWDGNNNTVTQANWDRITSGEIVADSDFYKDVINSGVIDLSCIEGTAYIAFKYIGSGEGAKDGTFELDDIRIAYKN